MNIDYGRFGGFYPFGNLRNISRNISGLKVLFEHSNHTLNRYRSLTITRLETKMAKAQNEQTFLFLKDSEY